MTDLPGFEVPQQLEKGHEEDDTADMGDSGHPRSEADAATLQNRSAEDGDNEEDDEEGHVADDRPKRDDGDAHQRADWRIGERLARI